MTDKVGIWIDHEKAIIVFASPDHVRTQTLESGVAGHPRYGGQQDGGGEKKYEERHREHLDRYYDDVVRHVAAADALLILGPGEAKLELNERLGRSKANTNRTVELETTDKLTTPQIVATVKGHFGLAR
jgi:hypothetical protein